MRLSKSQRGWMIASLCRMEASYRGREFEPTDIYLTVADVQRTQGVSRTTAHAALRWMVDNGHMVRFEEPYKNTVIHKYALAIGASVPVALLYMSEDYRPLSR